MKFVNAELKTTFEIPDAPTVRQNMRYDSVVELNLDKAQLYERLWGGVVAIAENWQSEHVQLSQDVDVAASPQAVAVIKWAGLMLFSFMQQVKDIDPN